MTTTYDDADLFSDAFTGFREVATSSQRHSRVLTALALVAAALLVVGALVWVQLSQGSPAARAADPASLVPALATTQGAADVIAAADREDLLIYPETTRLLLTTDDAAYYVAASRGNQLCLVSVPLGDLAQTACEPTTGPLQDLRIGDVMLVPTGATAPAGWHEAAANAFVRD